MALKDTTKNYSVAIDRYEAGRPGYPAALIDALPLAEARLIVDLGAGTGKFTRLLLPHLTVDTRIVAVEPAVEMSAKLLTAPGVEVVDRSASGTGLLDGEADLVACAQAFHWFDDEASVAEIARILRPGGTLALIWNMRDNRVAWVDALSKLIDGYAGDTPRHQTGLWQWVLADPRFRFERALSEEYPHTLPREGLFDRVLSISDIARLPETKKLKLRAKIEDILRENSLGGGAGVTLSYVSRLYLLTRQ